ncbi:hypothetical protein C8J42_101188 [Sphingomonas sp. PP-CE-1A-559]|nr:hypothetical protein C8J42_101188 [Sphingomonas sp. PP-CE-1A-559]
MPACRTQLHFSAKGSLAEREDWWWLCYDPESAEFYVEHEWDHMDPYRLGEASNKGTSRMSVEQWQRGGGPGLTEYDTAREKLLEECRKQ